MAEDEGGKEKEKVKEGEEGEEKEEEKGEEKAKILGSVVPSREKLKTLLKATPEGTAASLALEKGASKFKGLKLYYLVLIIVFIILFLIFFIIQSIGFLASLPLHYIIIIVGIFLVVIVGLKSRRAALALLIIFLALGAGAWYLLGTETGQWITGKAKVGSVVAGVSAGESLKGLAGPLNIMRQIFTGTYRPEELWSSEQVESEYSEVKDIGIVLRDVAPIKPYFMTNELIIVAGRIDAVSFPGTNINVTIEATGKYEKDEKENELKFECNPSSLSIKQLKNRYFSCSTSGLTEETALAVTVSAEAEGTQTIAGKQIVFGDSNAILKYENPLKAWGFTEEALKSWQKGDENINLGLGIAGNPTILEAKRDGGPDYYLGCSVQNPMFSKNTINGGKLYVILPQNYVLDGKDFELSNCDTLKEFTKDQTNLACYETKTTFGELKPADSQSYFLKLNISEDKLGGGEFGSFFVLAVAKYTYTVSTSVPVEIKSLGSS
ncbi:MAG: hypothetical protein ACP5JY_00995 [Candidatus Nanoarchaeia archaeon]